MIREFSHPRPALAPALTETSSLELWNRLEKLRCQPGLEGVLSMFDRAGRERRGGNCGEVPFEPQADESWLELLHSLISFSRAWEQADHSLRQAQDVGRTAETCHRLVPLTPALWQSVYIALRASLLRYAAGRYS